MTTCEGRVEGRGAEKVSQQQRSSRPEGGLQDVKFHLAPEQFHTAEKKRSDFFTRPKKGIFRWIKNAVLASNLPTLGMQKEWTTFGSNVEVSKL